MRCPACDENLGRVVYEGQPIFRCNACGGCLVTHRRVRFIKSSREQSGEALQNEAAEKPAADTKAELTCPNCLGRVMKKEKIPIRESVGHPFQVDTCRHCNVVWFDGGELAQMQLDHEGSAQGAEELQRQQRLKGLSTEQQEAFQKDLAVLRQSEDFLEAGTLGALQYGIVLVLVVVSLALPLFGVPTWVTIAAVLAAGAALGWAILSHVGISTRTVMGTGVAVLVVVAAWIGLVMTFAGK